MATKKTTADFMEVGKEVVPGMRLRCICRGHTGPIGRIAWSPCGRFIASPSRDKTIRIWDANSGKCLNVLKGHKDAVGTADWSPNGRMLVSGSDDNVALIWNVKNSHVVRKLDGHLNWVNAAAWSPDGAYIATASQDRTINLWNAHSGELVRCLYTNVRPLNCLAWLETNGALHLVAGSDDRNLYLWSSMEGSPSVLRGHESFVYSVVATYSKNVAQIASGSYDNTARIWDALTGRTTRILEGHANPIVSLSYSSNGALLASKSYDQRVFIWRTDTWSIVARIAETTSGNMFEVPSLEFSPKSPSLASLGQGDTVLRIWDVDPTAFIQLADTEQRVTDASAKVILVGESNVGKSCLAMRLAEDRYPDDHEQGTTHGMRFWPMEARDLHPSADHPEGHRRRVVLWDFGGQDEYQLVHQLFLHDTTLALVLIDPTRGQVAMDEARKWNKRLEKHLDGWQAVKLLVGAKQDRASELVNRPAIDALCAECGFAAYLETSAKNGRNVKELRERVAKELDWEKLAKTSRPELFQGIRDAIERHRENGEVVLLLDNLKAEICTAHPAIYEEAAVGAVADQLATQGVIAKTRLTRGEHALVLQVPVIERFAGALIMAARSHDRGIAALEERYVASKDIQLPGVKNNERLPRLKEKIVLECVVQLMIEHGLCFRHEGLYVFPSLFRSTETEQTGKFPHTVSLYYDFAGAVDNIYASLVAWLFLAKGFGSVRLWKDRAEFEVADKGACGVRKVAKGGGFAHLDVYFEDATPKKKQDEFVSFIEDHLRKNGLDLVERMALKCTCGYELPEEVVQERYKRGDVDVGCPRCDNRVALTAGAERAREHDPKLAERTVALRTKVEKGVRKVAREVRLVFSRARTEEDVPEATTEPIRILHVSDLHFVKDANVRAKLRPLVADLHDYGEGLGIERVDYLVITGDVTYHATAAQFERAREFISRIIDEFDLTGRRCILVPGNHDLSWDEEVYQWQSARRLRIDGLPEGSWREQGDGYLIRDEQRYPRRFQNYSDSLYHTVTHEPYPTDHGAQGISHFFRDDSLQFLAFNSCWEIDEFFPERASLHPGAVAHCLEEADKQLKQERLKVDDVLRIGVWHHPVTGSDKIHNTALVAQLQKAGVRLALHGHVHEDRIDMIGYKYGRTMHVAGAGSFGVWIEGRSPSTPQLYNLIEVDRDLRSIKVHTRYKDNEEGAWQGRRIWPGPDEGTQRTYYTVRIARSKSN